MEPTEIKVKNQVCRRAERCELASKEKDAPAIVLCRARKKKSFPIHKFTPLDNGCMWYESVEVEVRLAGR